ncbi:mitotic deacetylase-associated SANT domain protein-like [Notolabrus celidotus]|uniref:mitotic deacetylase-associated SANT domain protein-like n=1 Tax=Notolabrus celidotus TaxID=1203425 RepID=UPI0014900242|nr:mitotic deacetylase-associated SANT domain protein-like [Notolabrus celidotus]
MCVVCERVFRSLPALNGHMRSHSGSRSAAGLPKVAEDKPSVSMVIPVSVPVQSRGLLAKACKTRLSSATGGAVLYHSLLHPEGQEAAAKGDAGDDAHYTPPPMLCPLRAGPGLFCSLTTTRGQQRVQTMQLHNTHSDAVAMETASPPGANQPRINVGRGFQAEIPPQQGQRDADSHDALLLWTPLEELELPVCKPRVEALMMMASSSVMPGGGASAETALQVLSESRGDFLLTMEKLLSNTDLSARHKTGVCWSTAERKLLVKSLQLHHKDFRRIQRTVQTKSLSQCVEFYYLWKKKLSLSAKKPAGLTVTLPDANGQRSSRSHDAP